MSFKKFHEKRDAQKAKNKRREKADDREHPCFNTETHHNTLNQLFKTCASDRRQRKKKGKLRCITTRKSLCHASNHCNTRTRSPGNQRESLRTTNNQNMTQA